MTATAATGGMQWQQGDIAVVLDVAPTAASAALPRLWQRILDGVEALGPDDWERPTRCSEWAVVDIVNHLGDTGSWVLDIMDAAETGRHSTVFDNFEPRGVPKRLTEGADRTPAVARRRLREAIAAVRDRLAPLDAETAASVLLDTPLGPQPAGVGVLHLFWDTWLHERDLFLPLGRRVAEEPEEVRLAALYSLRMEGYIQTLFGRQVSVRLALDGAVDSVLSLEADGSELRIQVAPPGSADQGALRGDAAAAVDALCGRGELAAALAGPEEALQSVSSLRTILAGS
jgi:uncharacterized protein (TIGR03083 family)